MPLLKYVPTRGPVSIDGRELVATISERWPHLPISEGWTGDDSVVSDAGRSASFELGGERIAVIYVPAKIPWSDLEWPAATATFWPNATEELQQHDGLIHVVIMDSEADALSQMYLLTHAVWAVLDRTPTALGVYNGHANLVVSKDKYHQTAGGMPEIRPVILWLIFCVGPKDQGHQGYSLGMDSLGFPNVEATSSPDSFGDLKFRLLFLCDDLLAGLHLNDGDMIRNYGDGNDPQPDIIAVHGQSSYGVDGPVVQLRFDAAA